MRLNGKMVDRNNIKEVKECLAMLMVLLQEM